MKIEPATLDFRDSHHLVTGALVPRPIILISTVSEEGIFNVAPFSYITGVSVKPALIGFEASTRRTGQKKDTVINIEFSKEFVVNVVDESMAEAMNQASADYDREVDEFKETGLTPVNADIVKPPMVGESPVNFECRLVQILEFGRLPRVSNFIIGQVLLAHIKDGLYADGDIQSTKLKAIGRLGSEMYCRTTDVFEMKREFTL